MTKQFELDNRQIMAAIGNRYVIFGPRKGLEQPLNFDPEGQKLLPRVADESDFPPERLINSLQVFGMERAANTESETLGSDLALLNGDGELIFIEVKVRSHSPKSRELNAGYEKVRAGWAEHKNVEVWHFNTERLKLSIQAYDGNWPINSDLEPTDVWEKTESSLYRRSQVVTEVERWVHAIDKLYSDIKEWYKEIPELRFDSSRAVTMSEELMQKYAVVDRELPILDVLLGNQVLVSFVPRGLWLIGAWGRIDVIAQKETRILVMMKDETGVLEWRALSPENRRETVRLTPDLMKQYLGAV